MFKRITNPTSKLGIFFALVVLVILSFTACGPARVSPTFSFSQYTLAYQLIARYPDLFWCDPDFYPVGRDEEANALEQFPVIQANTLEFNTIMSQLGLPHKLNYSAAEKLSIYRQHKLISYGVQMAPVADGYSFALRTENEGVEGKRYEGIITVGGKITVTKTEDSFNICPICLAVGTLIATPDGLIPVELLRPGMKVWTLDGSGNRVAAPLVKTSSTPVPADFRLVRVTLDDGRSVSASPGHPAADNRPLADFRPGDTLDSAIVVSLEPIEYAGRATYDILPEGGSGLYWAGGILLRSTLW
jgi:hypothetical protein